jgi:hypothetical protein
MVALLKWLEFKAETGLCFSLEAYRARAADGRTPSATQIPPENTVWNDVLHGHH